jgi:hypothetical protein
MLLYRAKLHRESGAATVATTCGNCGNETCFELAYAKEGLGIGIPVVSWFTDKAVLAAKTYYLQCPICNAADKISKDAAKGLIAQGA